MFDIKIYGVLQRRNNIEKVARQLDLTDADIFYDDRPNGGSALYTAKKAFTAPRPLGLTHRIVLQDDVQICNSFRDICETIIATHPDKIFALFPLDWDIDRALSFSAQYNVVTPYIRAASVTGCGFIFPIECIQPYLDWVPDNAIEDVALFTWAQQNKYMIVNTIPSLIQHIGDESVLVKRAPIRRTKYFQENPVANWKSKIIIQ